ncbi:MAG: type IV pilus biogenesis/stability protein PilW, partial [Gammaproteobacteria bacterium]
ALAKDKLDRALAEDPGSADVHSARAMLFERMHNPATADAEFRTSLRLAPHDPQVVNNYAVYLCQNGRTEEGVRRFEEAAHNALYRTPEAAYTNAGVCLRAAKRDDEARADFGRALRVRPNFAEAAYQLTELQFQHGELAPARAGIDAFLGSYEATADLLLLGVRVARAQGDRIGAQRYARRLQLDFPGTDQVRALAELDRNPG